VITNYKLDKKNPIATKVKDKSKKAIPLQAWADHEDSKS
jgi:hypothetical protein